MDKDLDSALSDVQHLSFVVSRLENELFEAREKLRAAWQAVPADSSILTRPRRSDVPLTCHICGERTMWVNSKGLAQHIPSCPEKRENARHTTRGIPSEVWKYLLGDEDAVDPRASLDDE